MPLSLSLHAKAYVLALPTLALLYLAYDAWHAADDALNYRQTGARIVSIDDLCAPDAGNDAYSADPAWHPCTPVDIGNTVYKTRGREMQRKVVVDLRYVSPADGLVHDRKLTMGNSEASRNSIAGNADLVGATGLVMANLRDANAVHYDTWHFVR